MVPGTQRGGAGVSVGGHFERVAVVYESLRTTDEAPVRRIGQLLPERPVTALDIGCGTGRYTRLLRRLLPEGSRLFAEDVMQLAGRAHLPATPEGLILSRWDQADPARVLRGLSGVIPPTARIPRVGARTLDRVDQRRRGLPPGWTLLATIDGNDVGFIVGEATGRIVQMGVVPTACGKDIGARLIAEARAAHEIRGRDNHHAQCQR